MKKVFTILVALLISANSVVQAQDCLWAQSAGGSYQDWGNSSCTDASGNVYVTGSFSSQTITFGSIILTNSNSLGNNAEVFVVKYAPDGTVLWAKSTGGNMGDEGKSIFTDASGNVYLTGYFSSPTITFGTTTLINYWSNDIFIVKYNSEGTVLWAKSTSVNYNFKSTSVSADFSGNVYVIGSFNSSTLTFGTTILTNVNVGFVDFFIVKFSSDGTVLWAKSAGGIRDDIGKSVSTDASGNIYVTGSFGSSAITFGTTTLTNTGDNGYKDVFITKYAPDGTVLWAKSTGGNFNDFGQSVSADSSENVYITGSFESPSITFGSTTLTQQDNNAYSSVYIVKYTPDGIVLWAKSASGINYYESNSVSTDSSGNVYLTGSFVSDSISFGTTTLTKSSGLGSDIFIVKYSPDGTVVWANSAGGNYVDHCYGLCTDSNGNAYVTGAFYSPSITLGTITLNNSFNTGNSDFFIAKYSGVSTGLNEAFNNNQLIISPNPINSNFTLTMPYLKNSNVSITTLTGTEVGNYNTQNTSTHTIDISHLANGVYFVSLKSEEGGVVTKKIIKQ